MKKAILLISTLLILTASLFAQDNHYKIIATAYDTIDASGEWTDSEPKEVIGVLMTNKESIKIQINSETTEYMVIAYSQQTMGGVVMNKDGYVFKFAFMKISKSAILLVIATETTALQYLFTSIDNKKKPTKKV